MQHSRPWAAGETGEAELPVIQKLENPVFVSYEKAEGAKGGSESAAEAVDGRIDVCGDGL